MQRQTLTYVEFTVHPIEYTSRNERHEGEVEEVQAEEVGLLLDPLAQSIIGVPEHVEYGHPMAACRERLPKRKQRAEGVKEVRGRGCAARAT